jgi:23S rRNA pseudouridine1911/1915/1917 synthase
VTAADVVTFVADADAAGSRVDVVVGALPDVGSRAEAQRLITAGRVIIEGEPVTKRRALAVGDRVVVQLLARPASGLDPERVPQLVVRYEDASLVVVDKPAGVVTHPSKGHESGTLVHGLLAHGIAGGDIERPGIVHRLDRDTSGLLVVAKSDRAHRKLQRMLTERLIDRRYLVLVHGQFPPALSVDRPIGRDRRNRTRMSTQTDRPRDARTHFRRMTAYPRHSLLEARLDTGRTHQIRVHLEVAGFPVVGDPIYGRRSNECALSRQFLHAWHLAFPHPETDEPIVVESALPADLQAVLDQLAQEPLPDR